MLDKKELDYLMELLDMSHDSLIDLMNWEGQNVMTEEEMNAEMQLINSIQNKLGVYYARCN